MTSHTENDKEIEYPESEGKASEDVVLLHNIVAIDKSLPVVTSEQKIKELPYRLEELPDRWGKSIEDILRMVIEGKMKWWVLSPVVAFTGGPIEERYEIIEPGFAEIFLTRQDTYMEYFYGKGEPCRYYLKDFVVFSWEIAQVEDVHLELYKQAAQLREHQEEKKLHAVPKEGIPAAAGGAPRAPITEAVEWAYNKLQDGGNHELIKPGKIKGFLGYLKDCITEGNSNFSEYVSERIKCIKKIEGDCQIIMQDLTDRQIIKREYTGKNEIIRKTRISQILTVLRKNK